VNGGLFERKKKSTLRSTASIPYLNTSISYLSVVELASCSEKEEEEALGPKLSWLLVAPLWRRVTRS
jgi:hypothetical protein